MSDAPFYGLNGIVWYIEQRIQVMQDMARGDEPSETSTYSLAAEELGDMLDLLTALRDGVQERRGFYHAELDWVLGTVPKEEERHD